MIGRVAILGGGSAGFLAALALKSRLPALRVQVIRSREIGIIGVGEGSTPVLTRFLHDYVGIRPKQFFDIAQPTWKLGPRLLWGPRPAFNYTFSHAQLVAKARALPKMKAAYCRDEMENEDPFSALMSHDRLFERGADGRPVFHSNVAYHFENEKFVRFLEEYAGSIGVAILEDTVTSVEQDEGGGGGIAALRLGSGGRLAADLYVDASGFASVLLGGALREPFISFNKSLFCDRAVAGGWDRNDPEDQTIKPYTTCQTMDCGWCWQIEHENRINRGYVYCSAFIPDEDAEREFRAKNPKVGATRIVRFVSGRRSNLWVKNVVAVGNAGGFVEPLEATALGAIASQARTLADTLIESDGNVSEVARAGFNQLHARAWDDIRDFLAIHYKFNTRLDTPFWQHCRGATDLAGAAAFVDAYRETGPTMWLESMLPRESQFGMAGYLALLIGQQVQHRRWSTPVSDEELRLWNAERNQYKAMAARGLTVRDALAAIRSPTWKW